MNADKLNALSVNVNEIYISVQGESTWMGKRCIFIRLRGCPLRCHYCDTEYAFFQGAKQTIQQVLNEVERLSNGQGGKACKLVEVTGGEPLIQKHVHALMTALCDRDFQVLIETAGSEDIGMCDPRVIRIMDLKTPGSGESEKMHWENIQQLTRKDEVKFVLTSRSDYDWMKEIINQHHLNQLVDTILVSCVHEIKPGKYIKGCLGLDAQELVQWIIDDGLDVTFQTQLHKVIWDPDKKSV